MSYLEMLKKSQKHSTHITAKSDKRSIGSFGSGSEGVFLEKYTHDEELSKVTKGHVDNVIRSLQHECPLIHGGYFPPECRFEPRLLAKMTKSSVLPDPETGCPLRHICKLGYQLDDIDGGIPLKSQESPVRSPYCFNIPCQYSGYKHHNHIECLWCGKAQTPVIDISECPLGFWHKDENGWPVLIAYT